jgi:D-glycero-D-manno-heptose 1,7-bisphosphate phosphatase
MNSNLLQKVVFLDRDGVINEDSPAYIKSRSEFKFIPNSLNAIRTLTQSGFTIIVITNQSAVGRKLITREDLEGIHRLMRQAVSEKGGEIRDVFYCPHLPENGCSCRKPLPGLIYKARQAYRIDLGTSIMVGDNAKDIECARNAGCGRAILVKTGQGREAARLLAEKNISPDYVAEDLWAAVRWIVSGDR